jgi:hypothetical protein
MVTSYVAVGMTASFGSLTGQLLDVKESGVKADTVDVTHQTSTSKWREFKAGLLDGGEWTLTLLLDLDAVFPTLGDSGTLIVVYPTGNTKKISSSAIFSGRSSTATLGDKITCDLTFKITGTPSWSTST